MSGCIVGREVVLRFRHRKSGHVHTATVICPNRWTKGHLLFYCRNQHPNETVVIQEWKPVSDAGSWEPRFWIVDVTAPAK